MPGTSRNEPAEGSGLSETVSATDSRCTVPAQIVDRFGVGIDDTHIKLRGAPVLDEAALDSHQRMIADKLSVSELMSPGVTALPPLVPVAQLIETLRSCSHQASAVLPAAQTAEAGWTSAADWRRAASGQLGCD